MSNMSANGHHLPHAFAGYCAQYGCIEVRLAEHEVDLPSYISRKVGLVCCARFEDTL
jgi:hypothetical protein